MHALSHFYFSKNCITFALERLNSHMPDRLTDRRATATWWSRENNRSGVCVHVCVSMSSFLDNVYSTKIDLSLK